MSRHFCVIRARDRDRRHLETTDFKINTEGMTKALNEASRNFTAIQPDFDRFAAQQKGKPREKCRRHCGRG